jgi:hypothetical protein
MQRKKKKKKKVNNCRILSIKSAQPQLILQRSQTSTTTSPPLRQDRRASASDLDGSIGAPDIKKKVKVHPVANCNAALPFQPPDIDPAKMTVIKKGCSQNYDDAKHAR